ncbi:MULTISPECIES: hypothetical protein [Peribacillus]|uniref:hypothetical protein n=1 Tax=Peribacillus TaxID=2675229 RepID=UPI001595B5F6|nr:MULTISPECIES: hypothetical protein [Peribacillus]MBD8591644.1 hypothetical protein [Peribacillus simplex]MCM3170370.1 hypothetical protein [Peribacillus frigoritolerans]MEE3955802.1 hypothetical protein [Peribacillus frigoritolerans]
MLNETELRIVLTALGIVASVLSIIKTWLDIKTLRSKKKKAQIRKKTRPGKRK